MKHRNMGLKYGTFQMAEGDGAGGGGGDGGSGDGAGGAGSGDGSTDWRDSLPESVRGWDEFKNSDNMDAGFERVEHMRSKFGTGLFPPSEDASREDWSAFYGKLSEKTNGRVMPRPDADDAEAMAALHTTLGVPTEASEYKFSDDTDEGTATAMSELALKLKMTVDQVIGMDAGMTTILELQNEAANTQRTEELNTLKGEWGAAWDERSKTAEKVRSTFLDFIPAEAMNAATLSALYEMGKALGGEGSEIINQNSTGSEPTVLEAKDRIAELTSLMDQARKDNNLQELKRLAEKRRVFYKKAYPGGGITVGGKQATG